MITWSGFTNATGTRLPEESEKCVDSTMAAAGDDLHAPAGGGKALIAHEAVPGYCGADRRQGPGAILTKLLTQVLDEIDYGVVLIGADGLVAHTNFAARVELEAMKSMSLSDKRLVCRSEADQRVLDAALIAAREDGSRKFLAFEADDDLVEGKPCTLTIVPVCAPLAIDQHGCAVLVSFARSHMADTLSVDGYARELGLSRREQQVLEALCAGLRVKEIARQLGIGPETVRSYLKQVKYKAGCTGTLDLINQVWRLPPMVSSPRHWPVN